MTDAKWQKVREIFDSALRHKPDERRRFVNEVCGDDKTLLAEVESLLSSHDSAESFMETPAVAEVAHMIEIETKKLEAGKRFGHYEIIKQIGAGGMGEVYLAKDTRLERKTAIKILPGNVAQDEERMKRFGREAKSASALNHPNIITIYEIGETDNTHFIATEFIEGDTLRERLKGPRLNLKSALEIAIQVASALDAAHRTGIVHRDIKPENVMIRPDGLVKLLDFGIAKLSEPPAVAGGLSVNESEAATAIKGYTRPGMIIGTVAYMSPEQARGLAVDARIDVWSLGVVLYEMAAGRLPFEGQTSSDVISSILQKEPPALTLFSDEADARLDEIVTKALTKDREERYQSAKDLFIDLKRLKHHLDVEAEIERTNPEVRGRSSRAYELTLTETLETQPRETSRHPARASTAEYAGYLIKRHRLGAVVTLGMLALAMTIAMFWYFKHTRAAPVLTDKDTILLADFDNKTGDEVFDGALKQGLALQLGQSPFLSIFPESSVRQTLKLMNRSPDERVIREVAHEMCERQGLKAFIAGSIAPLGSHYVLTLEVVNVQGGEVLVRDQTEAESKEQVLKALSQAASSLREKLGESLSSINKFNAPLREATTSSLEALKSYSLGVDGIGKRGDFLGSIPFFKRAVELDPNFASAYSRLSLAYYNSGQSGLAVGYAQKAFEMRERVSGRERFFIESRYYSDATGDINKAIETYELWKQAYPRDITPWTNVSGRYLEIGQFEKTIENAREALRRNPNIAGANFNLAKALILLNRFAEATEVLERAFDNAGFHGALYEIAFVGGDTALMQQQLDWARGRPDEYIALDWQADTAAFAGQYRQAEDFSRRSINLATRGESKEVAAGYAAKSALYRAVFGRCAQAKESAAQSLALTPKELPPSRAALALALCGAAAQTEHLMDESARQYPKSTRLNNLWLPTIHAARELQRGNAAQAIELLQPASQYEAADEFWPQYLRGQAYLKLKQGAEAAAQFNKILDHRGEAPLSALYPLAHLGLARAVTLQGDSAKARKAYEAFFALWKDADTDIPILIEAKKQYEKLK